MKASLTTVAVATFALLAGCGSAPQSPTAAPTPAPAAASPAAAAAPQTARATASSGASSSSSSASQPHMLCVATSKGAGKLFWTMPYPRPAGRADADGRAFVAHLTARSYAKDAQYRCEPKANFSEAEQLRLTILRNAASAGFANTMGVPWTPPI